VIQGGDGTPEGAGRCLADGVDAVIENDLKYSEQPLYNNTSLAGKWVVDPVQPLSTPTENRIDTVYLDIWEREVDSTEDGNLTNNVIGIATCVRLKREWAVRVAEGKSQDELPALPPGHVFYPLALLNRTAGQSAVSAITDLRRTGLNLASLQAELQDLKSGVVTAEGDISNLKAGVSNIEANVNALQADVAILKTDAPRISALENNVTTISNEIINARGIKANLGNRLDESITAGGQLRQHVIGMDQLNSDVSTRLLDVNRLLRIPLMQQTLFKRNLEISLPGPYFITFDGTHLWVTNWGGSSVSKVDIVSNAAATPVNMSGQPYGIAFDGASVWVSVWNTPSVQKIQKINIATNALSNINVGDKPNAMAFDGKYIWAANYNGYVSKINTTNDADIAIISTGAGSNGVVYDGKYIWVSNSSVKSITKIDAVSNSVVATITSSLFAQPRAMAFDGSHVWAADWGGKVLKIDVISNEVVTSIPVGNTPYDVAFDGIHLWVSNANSNNVNIIDINTNTVVSTLPVGTFPCGLAFDGTNIWLANSHSSTIRKMIKPF
jgi:YVTN family beta-propeller protein